MLETIFVIFITFNEDFSTTENAKFAVYKSFNL